MSSNSGGLENGQPASLPRMPSLCELPGGVLPAQSSHTKVFCMASNSIPMQSSRRISMDGRISSNSFDIDPSADLIKPTSSDDTIDINVEIQRILGEDSDKSTSSHVESSTGRTDSSSLGCTEETQDAGGDAVEVSTKIIPVHYKQPLSPQEDTGSALALIAAAAAAAISAPNESITVPCAATNDEKRQRSDFRRVSHSLVGDRGVPYEPKAWEVASGDPYYAVAHQYQPLHSFRGGGVYPEYNTLPNANPPFVGIAANRAHGHSEYIPVSHSFGMAIHPSAMAPTGVACATGTWSRNDQSPPADEVGKIEEVPETKRWRRRRPKKKKASSSSKTQNNPFERRPAKGPGSRGKRGSYKCRLCGQAKAKHICSAVEPYDASRREDAHVQTETHYADEKIALRSGVRVIVVRERKASEVSVDTPGGKKEKLLVGEEAGEVILNVGHGHGHGNVEENTDIPFAAV